jgi:hypothetical protein
MHSEERDFYGDEPVEPKECIGYCAYCKHEIYKDDHVVIEDNLTYHKECFLLENTGEPGIND